MLRKIVNTEDGTAKLANVKNYQIAGKTGLQISQQMEVIQELK